MHAEQCYACQRKRDSHPRGYRSSAGRWLRRIPGWRITADLAGSHGLAESSPSTRVMSSLRDIAFVIKICGITNEEDARVALDAGANALGFNFYTGSPRYITLARAREIVKAVHRPFLKIGVFVNA